MNRVSLSSVAWPEIGRAEVRPELPQACFEKRVRALRERLAREDLDCAVIYADREHYANFKHFIGFEPRFEEGLAVIWREEGREDAVILGNECACMAAYARIPVKFVLCQALSLPGQPADRFVSMEDCLREAGLVSGLRVGLIGWKLFTEAFGRDHRHMFCVSAFIVEALRNVVGEHIVNATGLLIDPRDGLRLVNDADEIAYLEYGAALASQCVCDAWRSLRPGMREAEAAGAYKVYGQQLSCHVMLSSGENAWKGLVSPGFRTIKQGDPISMSVGLEGGLSCRGGYAAYAAEDIEPAQRDFAERVAMPYYEAVVAWYEKIGIGVTGGELYDTVDRLIPKQKFGWTLNPGHMIAYEEWLTSGIAPGSTARFGSGMLVQMDIIPSFKPYVAPNAEDGICIADAALREEIRGRYPQLWDRFMRRRAYMQEELGIRLKEEILPMSNLAGRYSPYLLDTERAFIARPER